jgi:hypothetical protein
MKEQDTGFENTLGQAEEEGMAGYAMTPLDVPLDPAGIAAIRELRKKAQVELHELIYGDTVKDHG